jgi:hypothetical protein
MSAIDYHMDIQREPDLKGDSGADRDERQISALQDLPGASDEVEQLPPFADFIALHSSGSG